MLVVQDHCITVVELVDEVRYKHWFSTFHVHRRFGSEESVCEIYTDAANNKRETTPSGNFTNYVEFRNWPWLPQHILLSFVFPVWALLMLCSTHPYLLSPHEAGIQNCNHLLKFLVSSEIWNDAIIWISTLC